jgi:GcrA cell cycle regulator
LKNLITVETWTDERTALLKRLHAEHHSYSYIAKMLGGVTRNAVCGKIHRLGLALPVQPSAPKKMVAPPAPRTPKQPMPKGVMVLPPQTGGDKAAAARAENIEARANPPENVLLMARAFAPLPGREPAPFGSRGCKWPVGGEGADTLQCGAARDTARDGCPYCPTHAAIAYQRSKAGAPKNGNELMRSLRRWAA